MSPRGGWEAVVRLVLRLLCCSDSSSWDTSWSRKTGSLKRPRDPRDGELDTYWYLSDKQSYRLKSCTCAARPARHHVFCSEVRQVFKHLASMKTALISTLRTHNEDAAVDLRLAAA